MKAYLLSTLLLTLPITLWAQNPPQPAGPAADTAQSDTAAAGPLVEDTLARVAPEAARDTAKFTVYGFAMADLGFDFNQINPDWFDTVRPTKLPSAPNEFGEDGSFYAGVRQTRFGARSSVPTAVGEFKTIFEFEFFGVGVDAGQTTIRPRHFYGQLGNFGAGQTWSPFMDIDVFPNSVEYWGPSGMAFFRNVQVTWMPIQGDTRLSFALERPGASGDAGSYADRIEVQNVKGRFPLPDFSGEFRLGGSWGYVELAGILRYIKVDDLLPDAIDLDREIVAGGGSFSSNIKIRKSVLRLQVVYGAGIQNYFNDAPADVGIENDFGSLTQPVYAKALPILGLVAFFDHTWSDRFTTSIGYSRVDIDNSSGQTPDAFHVGDYALANLMYHPLKNVMMGAEYIYGRRENNSDGFSVDDSRLQFSFKYSFDYTFNFNPSRGP